ncbi:MAG: hypothetical protein A3J09_01025 [Candidatus Zambryskibacteria bacterium RIFCSPLOWO2_02_FULL_51_21]|uniref:phenylalanine--tRNA ligase n=1 Tax=Candidatus Zambryskibacteria bacterium RIFCSPHIGHO2_02_FULL_43_37 TaxID=1802749 RepID=A0A1G2TI86_9BACT|nr:MAG: hypothetical protein A2723_01025 [Candidatus Zambryskibacteria bacterium RIFCSPHIGHO2_01_FULL_52_18]OHA96778.1 MAG: hypothetical protein A3D49_02985 [Candidatus Zambryskibacteria bacterium RIFCSPHIGHO2_02_FULL_43_37]OHB07471.1 MAG: hypothetical protein A2944_02055 [Candidatus Zambryskibacteria bacterium RIFCSPLOWO2_01_FULL_52_12]OHB11135.1 MAG: hypothetical protein A3J09_01025 [Candidatus Zambryskibacteria bacterium RIFCSPLOWO2_02_FULL_51_21]
MSQNIVIQSEDEQRLKAELEKRHDAEAERMKRLLNTPDLSRTPGSPIYEIVRKVIEIPDFNGFDIIQVPEIVPADISFDLFDFPADHPARSRSDTYYADDKNILRTHTTVMWYYYLQNEDVKKRMANGEPVGCFCFGKVYRKDEIDRKHMNIFHQIDGWYLAPKDKRLLGAEDLENALRAIAREVFGPEANIKIFEDTFPYTDPSRQMEIEKDGSWLEVLGSGVVKGSVLEKFGVDSSKWNGWAFGPGIERLAMAALDVPDMRLFWSKDPRVVSQLKLGNKYKEVSKYPPVVRDISFVVTQNFIANDYFEMVREVGGAMIEHVELLDKYENTEKFGAGKLSYTYRITYRHLERTLTNEEVNKVHADLEARTEADFGASIRRD